MVHEFMSNQYLHECSSLDFRKPWFPVLTDEAEIKEDMRFDMLTTRVHLLEYVSNAMMVASKERTFIREFSPII